MTQKLWKAAEAAERIGCSPTQLLRWARDGIVPCVKLGRAVRFDPNQVEEFIKNGGQAWEGGWKKNA